MEQKKVAISMAIKFFERFTVKACGLIINIVLARLLAPEVFGLLAIIVVFINLSNTFIHSGFGVALVQNKTTRDEDYSTAFYIVFAIAVFFTILLFFASPAIAAYYKNDLLIWPLRVLSFSLPFYAFNSIQTAKLQREMRFKHMMICNLAATVLSGVAGVLAAYKGAGLWALIVYNLSYTVLVSVFMLFVAKWYPKFFFSLSRAKVFFSFGWKLLVSGILCSLYYDACALIIGRRYSTTDLAYYNKGQQYPDLIEKTIDESIQSVMLPVMSQVQDSRDELNKTLLRSVSLSAFGVIPAMLGLSAVAKTMIPVILTEKWMSCVPLLMIFCMGYLAGPFQASNLIALKALGRSDIYVKVEVIRRAILLTILLFTVFVLDSVMAIAVGYAVGFWLDTLVAVLAVGRLTGVRWWRQLLGTWKSFAAGAVMFAVVYPMNYLGIHPFIRLVAQIVTGCVAYFLLSLLLKNDALTMGMKLLTKFFPKAGTKTKE